MSKDKDKDLKKYYANCEIQDARLHRLVALKLRIAMLSIAYYNKGHEPDDQWGLFDIVDPSEEAETMIDELRFFGFLPALPVSGSSSGEGT